MQHKETLKDILVPLLVVHPTTVLYATTLPEIAYMGASLSAWILVGSRFYGRLRGLDLEVIPLVDQLDMHS